jgi:Zn-dependent M16 (insulinase) family peptidase
MINEHVSGATAYLELKKLAHNYDDLEEEFLTRLATLRDRVFRTENFKISVTGAEQDINRFKPLISKITDALSTTDTAATADRFPVFPRSQAFCTAAEVVYNVQACSLFDDKDSYNGHFEVLKTWLSRDYLWNTVRQVGGAYGCFVQFNHITGNFGLVSYRDPQIGRTYEAYDGIAETLQNLELQRPVLDQLIIGTYGSFNPHQGPAAQGLTARNEYLSGITPAYKQQRIGEIIDTTVEKMQAFTLLFQNLNNNSFRATIGNCEKIREQADLFDSIIEL